MIDDELQQDNKPSFKKETTVEDKNSDSIDLDNSDDLNKIIQKYESMLSNEQKPSKSLEE